MKTACEWLSAQALSELCGQKQFKHKDEFALKVRHHSVVMFTPYLERKLTVVRI